MGDRTRAPGVQLLLRKIWLHRNLPFGTGLAREIFRFPKGTSMVSKLPRPNDSASPAPFNRSPRTRTGSHEACPWS